MRLVFLPTLAVEQISRSDIGGSRQKTTCLLSRISAFNFALSVGSSAGISREADGSGHEKKQRCFTHRTPRLLTTHLWFPNRHN